MAMSDHEFVAEMWKCRRGAQQAWKRIPKSNKAIRKWRDRFAITRQKEDHSSPVLRDTKVRRVIEPVAGPDSQPAA